MREPFDLPEDVHRMCKEYLGERALAIQQESILGIWLITEDSEGGKARYIPLVVFFKDILQSAPSHELEWLADEMKAMDITREAMICFVMSNNEQFVGRITLKDD